jgi:class 3 adenylate cyclase
MLAGSISVFYRCLGMGRSSRNPNICTRCSTHLAEGRLVELSVLFADLSSFTELTQNLGAEKTHEVVDAYLRMATEILVGHGAFIDKYVGDAVMALFGVPVRQDDHAQKAIAAAIEVNAALKTLAARFNLPLQASTGIATGFARVGRLGSDHTKDYTAIGDVVNLSARLQSKAGAGEILVNDECYRLAHIAYPDARQEEATLKGFRDPVRAYRLQHADGPPLRDDSEDSTVSERISVGAIIFGILGAPCAVLTLIGPLAVAVGATSLFGLAGILTFLDQSVLRIPLLILVALGTCANIYTVWHARELRANAKVPEQLTAATTLEKQRTAFVLAASAITFGFVIFEVVAHILLH